MTVYDTRISEPAEADIYSIFQYLFLRSPGAAERWRDQIDSAISSLAMMPSRCSRAPEASHFDREIRQLWFGSRRSAYRIVFAVFESTDDDEPPFVRILRVRHHAQQPLVPPDE